MVAPSLEMVTLPANPRNGREGQNGRLAGGYMGCAEVCIGPRTRELDASCEDEARCDTSKAASENLLRNDNVRCKSARCGGGRKRQTRQVYASIQINHSRRAISRFLPRPSTTSLSMPRGPSVVRTASAMAWQALMLLISWGLPCDVSVPSLRRIMGGCCMGGGEGRAPEAPD